MSRTAILVSTTFIWTSARNTSFAELVRLPFYLFKAADAATFLLAFHSARFMGARGLRCFPDRDDFWSYKILCSVCTISS